MRYFFNRIDGGIDQDTEGLECESLQVARHQAIIFAAESIRENPELVWHVGELRIEVIDAHQILVTTVIIQSFDSPSPMKITHRT